jgi:Tol biopolymer transport system component
VEPGSHPSITRSGDIYYNRVIHPVWGIITKIYHRQWPLGEELSVTKNELGDEYQPAVSRDGQILAFTSLRYFSPQIGMQHEVVDLLAYKRPFVEQVQLTQSAVVESDPAVDGTGKFVYATLMRDGKGEVWRFGFEDAKGERIAGLIEGKLTDCTNPSVDGQNRWCVYESTRDDNGELYLIDLATMKETRLTTTDAHESDPSLTEDGSKIVFVSDADGDRELYVMDRAGGNIRQLTDNDWDDSAPSVQ